MRRLLRIHHQTPGGRVQVSIVRCHPKIEVHGCNVRVHLDAIHASIILRHMEGEGDGTKFYQVGLRGAQQRFDLGREGCCSRIAVPHRNVDSLVVARPVCQLHTKLHVFSMLYTFRSGYTSKVSFVCIAHRMLHYCIQYTVCCLARAHVAGHVPCGFVLSAHHHVSFVLNAHLVSLSNL